MQWEILFASPPPPMLLLQVRFVLYTAPILLSSVHWSNQGKKLLLRWESGFKTINYKTSTYGSNFSNLDTTVKL